MGRAPLPHPLPIFRTTKVVAVFWLTQPTPLTRRLGSPSTFPLGTELLTAPIPGVKKRYFVAAQTLELAGRFHSHPSKTASPPTFDTTLQKENPDQQENPKEQPGRRAFVEALEENPRGATKPSDFQPARFIRLSLRRWHSWESPGKSAYV